MKTSLKHLTLGLILVSTMTLAACNKATPLTEIKDIDVTTEVKTTLVSDPMLKNIDITVTTLKGDVKLVGVVDSQSQIDHAVDVTNSIAGVHAIHNELVIKK
ncbi:MAG: BON domain-containing protein [Agitococcus sp.]|nr:BON domain-containing protein [Agitococcus sp.]